MRLPAIIAGSRGWDLTALLNAADPRAPRAEANLWLVRLLEWLRHAPTPRGEGAPAVAPRTPLPVVRLKHLLNVLDRHPEHRERVQALLGRFWREVDLSLLLAEFGFAPRQGLLAEVVERLRLRLLPGTTDSADLAALFGLLFSDAADAAWIEAIDDELMARLVPLFTAPAAPASGRSAREETADAIVHLALNIAVLGLSGALRLRMSPAALAEDPFERTVASAQRLRVATLAGDELAALQEAQVLRALIDACQAAAGSVRDHLEAYGISVDLLFAVDQLRERCARIDALLACLLAAPDSREQRGEVRRVLAELVRVSERRRSLRALLARQYSMLARKVAERSAETGEHYIARDRAAWWQMLRKALLGGGVLGFTTLLKFAILALGMTAFWGGFWAGVNYAASFVLIFLLHGTVATKQPAMTAPAMAAKLEQIGDEAGIERFVDEVTHLIRSQTAAVVGNLAAVAPVVLALQLAAGALFGTRLVSEHDAEHVLESLTLLGMTPVFAAGTGVLLFFSSLVAGWAENWFVLHRLDSAIRWNPRLLALLGAPRAQAWSAWWRTNVSSLAANLSLGLMLGIVPVVGAFFALPLEVRHVTLSTGQIAAAFGTLGPALLHEPAFWWCVAAIPVTGVLNVGVSYLLAFMVALRSRGVRVTDRERLYAAIRRRLRTRPGSFLWPPAAPSAPV